MDESAIERAKQRIEDRTDTAALDALLARTREQLESLLRETEQAAATMPQRVEDAVREGLREQVAPVGRNLAEIRGLMNQVIRRLEQIEGETRADRHARVDDLALLVDVITSGWQGVDERLARVEGSAARLETAITRLEQGIEQRGGAIVYRIEDRRPDAANGP